MENLEERILSNKDLFKTKFVKLEGDEETKENRIKFTGNWDNGWGNRVMKMKSSTAKK